MAIIGLVTIIFSGFFKYNAINQTQKIVSDIRTTIALIHANSAQSNATNLALIGSELKRIEEITFMNSRYDKRANILILFGSLTMLAGFGLWYFKLQKYQDIKIKSETQKGRDT